MLSYALLLDLGLSPDVPTLVRRTVALAEQMGFGLASGVLVRGRMGTPSASVHAFGNPPEGYADSMYSVGDGQRDPLLAQLLQRPGHAAYDQALYVKTGAADLWDCQAAFGFRAGLAVSLHQPAHGEAFLLGVDGVDALPAGAQRLRAQAALQMLAMHAQAAASRILAERAGAPAPDLGQAERAALKAAGATLLARRGQLVSVSKVADPALRSAVQKLGARSMTDAVLRCVDGGLIQL